MVQIEVVCNFFVLAPTQSFPHPTVSVNPWGVCVCVCVCVGGGGGVSVIILLKKSKAYNNLFVGNYLYGIVGIKPLCNDTLLSGLSISSIL